jgi:hypothetical protein
MISPLFLTKEEGKLLSLHGSDIYMTFSESSASHEMGRSNICPRERAAAQIVLLNLVLLASSTKRTLTQSGLNNCHEEIHQECCLQFIKQVRKGNIIFSFSDDSIIDIHSFENINFYIIKKDGLRQPISHLRSYLQKICMNIISKMRIKSYRLPTEYLDDIERYSDDIEPDHDHDLQNAIKSRLNVKERRIIELFYFKGLRDEEIRRQLYREGIGNYSTVNIRQIRSRAVEKLSNFFSKN